MVKDQQQPVRASIARAIAIDRSTLPGEVEILLKDSLVIPNPAREDAEREQTWGWEEIPEKLVLYAENDETLYVPRGFAGDLKRGLRSFGLSIEYADLTVTSDVDLGWGDPAELRDGQEAAARKLVEYKQGIIEATPGWGKTVMGLLAMKMAGQRSLIIVDRKEYADQWRNRASAHFGAELGLVGGGKWEERDVTVAMQQTLWSRRSELKEQGWFDKWGLVCLDECHHASANTYMKILNQFSARYRWGLSATPDREDGLVRITQVTIGDVLFRPGKEALRKAGQLVKPSVIRVPTPFSYPYRPTRRVNGKLIRNNYTKMISHMMKDAGRNFLVAENCTRNRTHLVVSDRLALLDGVAEQISMLSDSPGHPLFWDADDLVFLTGREGKGEREAAIERAGRGDCVVFSTIAKEALDIPMLDTLHLAYPMRKQPMLTQVIGRIERGHPEKSEPVVFDYFDPKVSVLRGQSRDRAKFYAKEGMRVESDF